MLEVRNVSKRFGPVEALRGVSLSVHEAECFGLVGDNGAGKSTLLKILSGVFPPDGGEIHLGGRRVRLRNPLDARRGGIEMIYQDLALCEDLDAAANIFLGRESRRRFLGPVSFLDTEGMHREASRILASLGSDMPADKRVAVLSGGERQLVAVARSLEFRPRLMLMDEPMAALSAEKVRVLLNLIERLKERGVALMLVSHRFTDIIDVCDRIAVLRQGELVAELQVKGQAQDVLMSRMISLMSGKSGDGQR